MLIISIRNPTPSIYATYIPHRKKVKTLFPITKVRRVPF
jgi:hypothetical protein